MRNELIAAAAEIALNKVGATEEESQQILAEQDLRNLLTWPEHRLWARTVLAQLRAKHVDE